MTTTTLDTIAGARTFNVAVRYRSQHDGYRTISYQIRALTAEDAKFTAIMRAMRMRGSSMHEAEITLA